VRSPSEVASEVSADEIALLLSVADKHSLVGQPLVDLQRGTVVGYELLSRFALDRPVPVPPDRVFAAAERQDQGAALEAMVLGRAIAVAAKRPANCFVTVNVDPAHLEHPAVRAAFGESSLAGIVVELTEHRPFSALSGLRQTVERLRAQGALIALDDAGAGHAGLREMVELKPELIKLDRALIMGLHESEAKRTMVQMVGELANRLDAWLLAEGVEEESEADALMKLGVPLGQGYFFGRPGPLWSPLTPAAEITLSGRTNAGAPSQARLPLALAELLTPCHVVSVVGMPVGAPLPTSSRFVVAVDEHRAPAVLQMVEERGIVRRERHQLMRIKREMSVVEVTRRMIAREPERRWDPLVFVDDLGRFLGIVTCERLVCALADAQATSAARSQPTERADEP
jgi:EAL domain-containing protein (putative c-di-GMP-specific phosphodiesterase class I)